MVAELKEVIQKVEQLNNDEQIVIARLIEDELTWDATLKNTQTQLSKLAQEAIEEHKSGKTKQTDW